MPHDLASIVDIMIEAAIAAAEVICEVYERPHRRDGEGRRLAGDRGRRAGRGRDPRAPRADRAFPCSPRKARRPGAFPSSASASSWSIRSMAPRSSSSATASSPSTSRSARTAGRSPASSSSPPTGALYWGSAGGAFEAEVTDGVVGPSAPLAVDGAEPYKIVASRSHGHAALEAPDADASASPRTSRSARRSSSASSRGACAQLYPRFTPTSEWDTAAGQAVLEAAGGVVLTLDGEPLRYGKAGPKFLNPFFVAAVGRRPRAAGRGRDDPRSSRERP